jgi:hypothetical protein
MRLKPIWPGVQRKSIGDFFSMAQAAVPREAYPQGAAAWRLSAILRRLRSGRREQAPDSFALHSLAWLGRTTRANADTMEIAAEKMYCWSH